MGRESTQNAGPKRRLSTIRALSSHRHRPPPPAPAPPHPVPLPLRHFSPSNIPSALSRHRHLEGGARAPGKLSGAQPACFASAEAWEPLWPPSASGRPAPPPRQGPRALRTSLRDRLRQPGSPPPRQDARVGARAVSWWRVGPSAPHFPVASPHLPLQAQGPGGYPPLLSQLLTPTPTAFRAPRMAKRRPAPAPLHQTRQGLRRMRQNRWQRGCREGGRRDTARRGSTPPRPTVVPTRGGGAGPGPGQRRPSLRGRLAPARLGGPTQPPTWRPPPLQCRSWHYNLGGRRAGVWGAGWGGPKELRWTQQRKDTNRP